jgi:putative FmdB family regulatory protein
MPIYAYKCAECGFEQDVMQKMSDALLTECPSCGKSTFTKQLSAAGFHLKGSGYYATDFKNSGSKPADAASSACGTGACPACVS